MKMKWLLLKRTQPTLLQLLIQNGRNLRMMTVTQLQVIFDLYSVIFCMWHLSFYFNRQCSTKTLFFSTTTIWQVSIHVYYNMISKMKIIMHLNTITSAMKVKLKGWMLKQIQPTPFQSLIQRRRNLSMMIVTGLQVILICCVTVCKRCKCDTLLFILIGDAPPKRHSLPHPKVS